MDILNHSWDSMRIKHLFEERVEKNSDSKNDYLSIVKDVGVIPYSEKGNVGNKTSNNPEKYKRVYPDDLVINPMNVTIGSVGISNHSGCLSNVYMVLKPKIEFYPQYYGYLFQIKSFQKSLRKISYGIMEIRESINKIEFFRLELPYPPLHEQQQIVSFLDTKISLIDSLIEKTQRKMELLKEKRTSLINEVVTKGLNPNVEMKDSGVKWIGEIPRHWDKTKPKYQFDILGGGTPSKDISQYWDGDIPWVSPKDMKLKYISTTEDYTTIEGVNNSSTKLISQKSLLMVVRSGILQHTIPVSFNSVPVTINQDLKSFEERGQMSCFYFYYLIKGHEKNLLIEWSKEGTTVESIEMDFMMNSELPLPSILEQQQIVEYLDEQTQLIDKTISIEEKRTELLKEYRQSLISEVVTGKRKVV